MSLTIQRKLDGFDSLRIVQLDVYSSGQFLIDGTDRSESPTGYSTKWRSSHKNEKAGIQREAEAMGR